MEKNVKVDQGLGLMMWQYFFSFLNLYSNVHKSAS